MLGVGAQLIDALGREHTFNQRYAQSAAREARSRVDSLAVAYLEAIDRYREAMDDALHLPKGTPSREIRASAP